MSTLLSAARRPLGIAVAVLAVLGVLWVGAYAAAGDGVRTGTTVRGVSIGGLAPAAAQERLVEELQAQARAPIEATVGSETFLVEPASIGLSLDFPATVDAAGRKSWNPVRLVRGFFGDREVAPVLAVHEEQLAAGVQALAARANQEPVPGDVTFRGASVVPVAPEPGRILDQEDAAEELRAAYLRGGEPVELPAEFTEPSVSEEEVARAVREFAQPAMAAPVTVLAGDASLEVTPEMISPALSMEPTAGGVLAPRVDAAALDRTLAEELGELEQPAQDAQIVLEDGGPQVVPAEQGREISPEGLATKVLRVLPTTGEREIRVETEVSEPDFTSAEAEALGVTEVVGEFTTYYPDAQYRRVNIGRAAELIDGTLLLPGETFSLNDIVGERTEANGFTEGTIILGGQVAEALGGGVSQVATTTFNAMFFAGLEDLQHQPHSFYISRYPVGREATVSWGSIDLRFRNDTDYGVLVDTEHQPGESLTVRMWSTPVSTVETSTSERFNIVEYDTVYDASEDCIEQDGTDGFDIEVDRTVTRGGEVTTDETFFTRYNPAAQIFCRPAP
jgi:vancomycin resistance protein YoaR